MAIGDQIRSGASATAQPVLGGISQTAFIFATIAFLFLFYITIKGDLGKWLGLFAIGSKSSGSTTASMPSNAGTNTLGSALPDVLSGQHNAPPALPSVPTIDNGTWDQTPISTGAPDTGTVDAGQWGVSN